MSRTRISTAREAIFECIEVTGSADLGGEDFEHISEHLARWAFDPTISDADRATFRRLAADELADWFASEPASSAAARFARRAIPRRRATSCA